MLEFLPLAAGMILLVLIVGLDVTSGPVDEDGHTWAWRLAEEEGFLWRTLDILLGFAVMAWALVVLCGFLAFMVSGMGWVNAGHRIVGLLIFFGRGWVSLGVLNILPSQGGLSIAIMYFIASMAMAAGSALALPLATRPRDSVS